MISPSSYSVRTSGSDKISLFRQQALIISRKKAGTAQRYRTLQEEINTLNAECKKKRDKGAGIKVLKGEDFKKYVAELRIQSTVYKKKKTDVSQLVAEYGILARTEEILKQREKALKDSIGDLETKKGALGLSSSSKFDADKGKTMEELSEIVQSLSQTINVQIPPLTNQQEKKQKLAPVIQSLRTIRQNVSDLESEYADKKRAYDATMAGLDSTAVALDQEVKAYRAEITGTQSKLHLLNTSISFKEAGNERVAQEMKAYIGGDDVIEAQQRARGFKTYRDHYIKRIQELEISGKKLRESQKAIKVWGV
jgi:intraflagellar transport protein 81